MNENEKPQDCANQVIFNRQQESLVKDCYTIYGLLQNQRYLKHNIIVKNLIDRYKATFLLDYDINIQKISDSDLFQQINKLGNVIFFEQNDHEKHNRFFVNHSENECIINIYISDRNFDRKMNIEIYSNSIDNIKKCKERILYFFNSYLMLKDNSIVTVNYYTLNFQGIPVCYGVTEEIETQLNFTNYPFIKNIDNLINEYLSSKASILFLMGPPGTGKTKFIRYLLSKQLEQHKSVYFTSDKAVIEHGIIFTEFLQSNSKILILEDFDFHLNSRKEGNTIMYHLLGVSDGLIQSQNKKIIISTNLSSLVNIDEAVIRKGRCFDILDFRLLLWDEVIEFMKQNNNELMLETMEEKEYSLADLYYIINTKNIKKLNANYQRAGFK
jgi:hypothetical protein